MIERFWEKVDRSAGDDGCWLWIASTVSNGYGSFRVGSRNERAHRVSFEFAYGPIPDGLQINHHCDNKLCVNPSHLYAGDQLQNRRDAVRRGRTAKGRDNGVYTHPESRPRGERNGMSKLSDKQRMDIRRRYSRGLVTQAALAREFGVTRQSIWALVRG